MVEQTSVTLNGDEVRISIPISKIDKERRIVSGFASIDNVDQHDEIIPIDTAVKAFKVFRGNLREMHQPKAVGKVLSFSQQPYYDEESQKSYQGVYVQTYVSLGAEDTWQKCLDGTLSGFSVGGNVRDQHTEYNVDEKKMVRTISELQLLELSLVDSPANQFANVLSIQKGLDGSYEASGMATEVELSTVFWCPTERVATVSVDESRKCNTCDQPMENIGWIESSVDNQIPALEKVIHKFLDANSDQTEVTPESDFVPNVNDDKINAEIMKVLNDEGGVNTLANEETVEVTEEVAATTEETVTEVSEVESIPAVEKAAEVSEVEAPESFDIAKAFGTFSESVEKTLAAYGEKIDSIEKSLAGVEALTAKQEEISESLTDVKKSVETVSSELDEVKTGTERLEAATAVKKSGDLETAPEETIKKSLWGNRFVSAESLTAVN